MVRTLLVGMRGRLAILVGLTALTMLAVILNPADRAEAQNSSVQHVAIVGIRFFPRNITIHAGTTVHWMDFGILPHTVTSDDESWDSGTMHFGDTFQRKFNTVGVFPYHCHFHEALGMVGIITVVE